MKKILIVLAMIILILSLHKESKTNIPKESIRFRIIANSNEEYDQEIKKEILKNLSTAIKQTNNFKNIEETRIYIKNELPVFNKIVEKTLKETNRTKDFNISYGKNYFPQKTYKNINYEEGEYESLVITLGEGKGNNFWCVLFPPLCLVDETEENVEYDSIIKKVLNKYF